MPNLSPFWTVIIALMLRGVVLVSVIALTHHGTIEPWLMQDLLEVLI